jgi:ABC-2 type transport system permease protein
MSDAVHEPSYEAYEGPRTSSWQRLAAVVRRGLGHTVTSPWFWALVGVTLIHVGVRGVSLYVTGQVDLPQGTVPEEAADQVRFTSGFLSNVLATQARWIVTFMLVVAGADAIAEDLEAGGLTFYFTKPLTKSGYALAKLATPFTACMLVTALPLLVVWGLGMAFTPSQLYPDSVWLLPLGLIAASAVISAMTTLIVGGLSAVLGSSRRASLAWVALVVILAGATQVLQAVTVDPATVAAGDPVAQLLVDPYNALERVTGTLLSIDPTGVFPPAWGAWLTTAGWSVLGALGITYALQREEVAG